MYGNTAKFKYVPWSVLLDDKLISNIPVDRKLLLIKN